MMTRCNNGHQPYDTDVWKAGCPDCMPVDPRPRTSGRAQSTVFEDHHRSGQRAPQPTEIEESFRTSTATSGGTVVVEGKDSKRLVGWVVVLYGPQRNTDFRLVEGANRIGRGPESSIRLKDPVASTLHACISYDDGAFELYDMGSQNGTFVNDNPKRITRQEIRSGDVIRVGDTSLKFVRFE